MADSHAERARLLHADLEQAKSREESLESQIKRSSRASTLVFIVANASEILVNEIAMLHSLNSELSLILGYGLAGRASVDPMKWRVLREDVETAIKDHQDAQYQMQWWVLKCLQGELDPYSRSPEPQEHFERLMKFDRGVIPELERRVTELKEEFEKAKNAEFPARHVREEQIQRK